MGLLASTISTIPASGFKWYLIFLEGPFQREIRKEIDKYFETLAREVGKDALVVRGLDKTSFKDSFDASVLHHDKEWMRRMPSPALIVMDCAPLEAFANLESLNNCKMIIFPIGDIYKEKKSIGGFLESLVNTLKQDDAIKALETVDPGKLEK